MSEISDAIQDKCLAFGDRVIKLNDYLLEQAASRKYDGGSKRYDVRKGKSAFSHQTSNISQPSSFSLQPSRVPVHLQSVAALANQLLRSGTSIGANNAEASSAISKADFKSKSYIALKEARESLYWLELLHRNNYLTDEQFASIYADAEELVRILVARCKKLDAELNAGK
jgi:four helix bundle protein